MSKGVLISIIAYNAGKTLRRAVNSVLRQTHSNLELHLLDNGSADTTADIIMEYATKDPRVVAHRVQTNNVLIYRTHWREVLAGNPQAEYFAVLDADDAYAPDFLRDTVSFLERHDLDCVACGTRLVEEGTERLLSERVPECELTIERSALASEFLRYRRHYMPVWGKLYRTRAVKAYYAEVDCGAMRDSGYVDFEGVLGIVSCARRIGLLPKILHTYYRSPNSLDRTYFGGVHLHLMDWIAIIRNYLLQFGPLSKQNEDYLHAIYLGQLDSMIRLVCRLRIPLEEKLRLVLDMLELPDTHEMLVCRADPQFQNLAAREAFLREIWGHVSTLEGFCVRHEAAQEILALLSRYAEGGVFVA